MAKTSCSRISGPTNIKNFNQVSGGTTIAFYRGDIVQVDSNGYLVIGTTTNNLGIAMCNAPGNTTTNVPVDLITAEGEFAIPFRAASTTQTLLGEHCQITYTVNGEHYLTESGTGDCVITGFFDAIGTTSGKMIVQFLPSGCQVHKGA